MKCFMKELYSVILERITTRPQGSYTVYLAEKGIEYTAKKIGEEAAELIIEAVKRDRRGIISEAADLIYHLLVLLAISGISLDHVTNELIRRRREA